MDELPPEILEEVRNRVELGNGLAAIKHLQQRTGLGLADCIAVVLPLMNARRPSLDEQLRVAFAEYRDRDLSDASIVRGYWDGDTHGWFTMVEVAGSQSASKPLLSVSFRHPRGDLRIFDGDIQAWAEREIAEQFGREIAEGLGVDFVFDSSEGPDS